MSKTTSTFGFPDTVEAFQASPRYRTGVAALDIEHAQLFAQCRALVDALADGRGLGRFQSAFEALMVSARRHFRHEEMLMRSVRYPDYDDHKAEHDRLLRNARDFAVSVETHFGRVECSAVAKYLRYWLLGHIERYDAALGRYVAGEGDGRDSRPPARAPSNANEIRCQV